MRKFSTYLALLLGFAGGTGVATAQESVYLLNDARGGLKFMALDADCAGAIVAEEGSDFVTWNLLATDDGAYQIYNVGAQRYLGTCATSEQVAAVTSGEEGLYVHTESAGRDYFQLQGGGAYQYLHAAGGLNVVGWEMNSSPSSWFICPVQMLDFCKGNMALQTDLDAAVAEARRVYASTQSAYVKLITGASQFASNYKDPEEGSFEALLDGDDATFFHSSWHDGSNTPAHDLQVTVPGNSATELWVEYKARNASGQYNDRPVRMNVYGGYVGADGVAVFNDTPFAELTTDDGLGDVSGRFSFTADAVYTAFRFEVLETVMSTGATGNVWFTYGEFQLFDGTMEAPEYEVDEAMQQALLSAIEAAGECHPAKTDYADLISQLNDACDAVRSAGGMNRAELVAAVAEAEVLLQDYMSQLNTPGYFNSEQAAELSSAILEARAVADASSSGEDECRMCKEDLLARIAALTAATAYCPTDAYFVINNDNASRGAIVYDPVQSEEGHYDADHNDYLWYAAEPDANDANHLWGFYEAAGGEVYLYNVGRRLFASSAGEGTYSGRTWIFSDVPSAITMESMGNHKLRIMGDGETMSVSRAYTGPIINYYAPTDGGVPFKFTRATDGLDADVTLEIERLLSGEPTGVNPVTAEGGLRVKSVTGGVAVTASAAAEVSVVTAAGAVVRCLQLTAGTTQTVGLPAGVYVVGGEKVLVK